MTYREEMERTALEDHRRNSAVCPLCEGPATTTVVDDTFTYGAGSDAVELHARLPVRRCDDCDINFLDEVGERIRTEAVYRHHGLLTPREIRATRERRGMSRAAFAEATALGEATIKRWETGATPQNRANDRYIRLLSNDICWSVLQRIVVPKPEFAHGQLLAGPWRQLSLESAGALRAQQQAFTLHGSQAA